ncbi:MAG TPA: Nif3-like dinuclear metal center hexameric protein [Frankiaceae bacterium]|nr:Nif3-like dinuclear metal center hexameric protein [Frankiaceae bacterium]
MTRVGDWIAALESLYDPSWAEDWDAVGLVTGDPDAPADGALFAIDPVEATVDEAVRSGARLLVTHHPLLLRGVHGVPVTDYKGALVDRLVREGVALYVAHTNADVAAPGVSDALASALGVRDALPLSPGPPDDAAKIVVYVPPDAADQVVDALAAAGAGTIGEYARCAWWMEGTGTYEASERADPAVGAAGERTETAERRVEMVVPHRRITPVIRALLAAHPYEEPAYDVLPVLLPHDRGLGRIGTLAEPVTLGEFAASVAAALPFSGNPVRVAGDPARPVRRVAVCGGAGDGLVDTARRAGADVYVTADLRHHPVSEARERGLAVIDAGHWATEHPWLADAAERVANRVGNGARATVSTIVTDPWSSLA